MIHTAICTDCFGQTPRNRQLSRAAGNGSPQAQATTTTTTTEIPETGQWNITRFRVNVFTNREWPTIFPQTRDDFSIGVEQSASTVAGLAWSPPGLAKHRRCTLAVLTTNLLLSFYEPLGPQGKWVRVAIVNQGLNDHFSDITPHPSTRLKKSNIRAFSWCPTVKIPSTQRNGNAYAVPGPESRWGIQPLVLANDDNEVLLLEIQRAQRGPDTLTRYSIRVLSSILLHGQDKSYPPVQPESLFAAAIRSRVKVSSISAGPWAPLSDTTSGRHSVTAAVAATYGTQLRIIKVDVSSNHGEPSSSKLEANLAQHPIDAPDQKFHEHQFTGPLRWLYTVSTNPPALLWK